MEQFTQKLKSLREQKALTQQQLADQLQVRLNAIEDWESGKGTPDFEDLAHIANFFDTEVDQLVTTKEAIQFAEKEITWNANKYSTMILCLLDALLLVLLVLPVFESTYLLKANIPNGLIYGYFGVIVITGLNGLVGLTMLRLHKPVWLRHRVVTGFALSVLGVILFMATGQQSAGILYLSILLIKGLLLPRH